jgi:hypothetical protein
MNTKFFTGLALAAALLIGQPAFAYDKHGGGKVAVSRGRPVAHVHAVAAVHHGGGVRVAAVRGPRGGTAVVASRNTSRGRSVAAARTFSAPAARGYAAANYGYRGARNSVAFGGSPGYGHGTYAFASHDGWDHGRAYFWHGHHYRWYDNAWFVIDPGYGYYGPAYGYYNSGTDVSVQVQTALYNQGYYQGPIDGMIGPGTSAAIAAYQQDNGLRVTGTITPALLNNLGIG